MGYALNELANLPVDENIHFYIFVVNGQYREPLYDVVQENFMAIAKSIGSEAVIAVGTEPKSFTSQVAEKIFGKDSDGRFFSLLPALIITNAHPDKLTKDSVRLVVPLRDAEERFGGWPQFFSLLSAYVRGESNEFVKCFQANENLVGALNKIVSLKPGIYGVSININELIKRFSKRRVAKTSRPSAP
jgi:hypothetical protein